MKLEDLVPAYPTVDDPRLQAKLTVFPEFADVQGLPRENVPERGEYFRHQRAILRYMRIYDRLFLFHRMGTGKTCTISGVGNFYKRQQTPPEIVVPSIPPSATSVPTHDVDAYGPTPLPSTAIDLKYGQEERAGVGAFVDALVEFMSAWDNPIKHAFILVKGPFLRRDFERQIACECAAPGDITLTAQQINASAQSMNPDQTRRSQLRREVKKWFTVETTGRFVSHYLSRYDAQQEKLVLISPEEMQLRFNHCLFVVDEVHALFNEARDGSKKGNGKGEFHFVYTGLHTLFHTAPNIKVMLASGTPMINSAAEIKSEMNLILPTDHQMPKNLDVTKATLADLEPYFRGRVSFVRELDTGARLELQGDHFGIETDEGEMIESVDTVFVDTMSAFQTEVYTHVLTHKEAARKKGIEDEELDEGEEEEEGVDFDKVNLFDMTAGNGDSDELSNIIAGLLGEGEEARAAKRGAPRRKKAKVSETTHTKTADQDMLNRFYLRETNASMFVFPDGSIGGKVRKSKDGTGLAKSGLGRYVYSPSRNVYEPIPSFRAQINTVPKLQNYSAILASIVEDNLTHPGKKFVFTPKVEGGGAIITGVAHEANGYERILGSERLFREVGVGKAGLAAKKRVELTDADEATDTFDPDRKEQVIEGGPAVRRPVPTLVSGRRDAYTVPGVCGTAVSTLQTVRKINLPKGRRYAMIVSGMTDSEIASILELWRAPENVDGEYLEVLIGSPISRDGINLPETQRVHLLAGWTASGTAQAIGRVDRANAYVLLLERAKQQARLEGRDPDQAQVDVAVFKHAAVPSDETIPSIDIALYAGAERKDREIKRVERFMMQSAFDCHLNYRRNVRPGVDQDGSAECAYEQCVYECAVPLTQDEKAALAHPAQLDPSVMLLTSSQHRIGVLADRILEHLFESPIQRVDHLAQALGETMEWVSLAADQLVRQRRVILDRWGFPCRVVAPTSGGGLILLHRGFDLSRAQEGDPFTGYGAARLEVTDASTFLSGLRGGEEGTEWVEGASVGEKLDSLPIARQVALLERALSTLHTEPRNADALGIVTWYERYLFAIRRPDKDLAQAEEALSKRGIGRGRKAKIGAALKLKFEVEPGTVLQGVKAVQAVLKQCRSGCEGTQPPWILVHILEGRGHIRTSYAVAAQLYHVEGTVRVWEPGTGWRDATLSESPVYKELIQRKRDATYVEHGDLFGSILSDGHFRIHDQTRGTRGEESRNRREEARGKVCLTWPLVDLVHAAARSGTLPAGKGAVGTKKPTEKDLATLTKWVGDDAVRTWSPPEQRIALAWYDVTGGGKLRDALGTLCDAIEERFRREGKLEVS